MPEMASWLTPKRRRTTGNLKTLPKGPDGSDAAPSTTTMPRLTTPKRPSFASRPVSQPYTARITSGADSNLFYAYARKGNDLRSRFLLTFASASTANEWWLLIQAHFPDCTRPGPQLFSFETEDLLSKAWKHGAFEHLKSKWMYITFSDSKTSGMAGAAQGIIPVQDEYGNMLGGGSPASPELLGQVRKETDHVKNKLSRMDEDFEKMMEAVERNTDSVRKLGEGGSQPKSPQNTQANGGFFDSSELAAHFGRLTDLVQRNTEFAENMSKKQFENERKLQLAFQDVSARQRADYLDMSQLSQHLDRIQNMMEASIKERRDSTRELAEQQQKAAPVDLAPLTSRMEKMQEAVEQNSALLKALLDEGPGPGAEPKPSTPFWAKESGENKVDLSPLTEHLQSIRDAIDQQSSHMQALVGFANGSDDSGVGLNNGEPPSVSLAPLAEHLEQIYNVIEEGNQLARQRAEHNVPSDFASVSEQLEAIHISSKQLLNAQQSTRSAIEKTRTQAAGFGRQLEALNAKSKDQTSYLQGLLETQEATRQVLEESRGHADLSPLTEHLEAMRSAVVDTNSIGGTGLAPLTEHLEAIRSSSERHGDLMSQLLEAQHTTPQATEAAVDLSPLTQRLEDMRSATEKNTQQMKTLTEAHSSTARAEVDLSPLTSHLESIKTAVEKNNGIDFTPLAEHLESIRTAVENNNELDFTPLADHFEAMRTATEESSEHLQALLSAQEGRGTPSIDLTPLTDRLNRIHASLEKANAKRSDDSPPTTGDPKFLMTALTSHLSKIQSVTEQNALAVKSTRERQTAGQDKLASAVAQTSEHVGALAERSGNDASRLEATESQVRQLMAGQREMVKVMRELAQSITAQNKGACDHVVIPPPRKVGRKIVGFVYDAKEGPL